MNEVVHRVSSKIVDIELLQILGIKIGQWDSYTKLLSLSRDEPLKFLKDSVWKNKSTYTIIRIFAVRQILERISSLSKKTLKISQATVNWTKD